jgi:N-acetyltransferase
MQTLGLDKAFFESHSMILQPTLTGQTLFLRPTIAEDKEPLFAVASDREIWAMHPMHNRWQRPVFDVLFDEGLASGGALTVIDRSTGLVIGSSRYGCSNFPNDSIEIGWTYLARAYWGGQYNAEMKFLMISHALQHFKSVFFMVGEPNLRSRKAMEKIGGQLTDRIYQKVAADGVPVKHVMYEINAEIFAQSPLAKLTQA